MTQMLLQKCRKRSGVRKTPHFTLASLMQNKTLFILRVVFFGHLISKKLHFRTQYFFKRWCFITKVFFYFLNEYDYIHLLESAYHYLGYICMRIYWRENRRNIVSFLEIYHTRSKSKVINLPIFKRSLNRRSKFCIQWWIE